MSDELSDRLVGMPLARPHDRLERAAQQTGPRGLGGHLTDENERVLMERLMWSGFGEPRLR